MSYTVEQIHYNDIGTVFRITLKDSITGVVVDVSDATTLQIILQDPEGTNITKTASFTTDGTDGVIECTSVDGDLDVEGDWKLQVFFANGSGSWHSNITNFRVHANL